MTLLEEFSEEELREEQRLRRKRLYRLFGLFLLGLVALSFLGNRNLLRMYAMHRSKVDLEGEIQRLKASVEALSQETELLKRHPERLEEIAREELGLVMPDEIVYQFSQRPSQRPGWAEQ